MIPEKCRAAVLSAYNAPLEIRELPIPRPGPGAILVKVEAATVCGTDVHIYKGELAQLAQLPLVMGHEIVGRVVELGEGVRYDVSGHPLRVGDRIVWAYPWCGRCYWCAVLQQPTLCTEVRMYGWSSCEEFPYLRGGFAEYCYVLPECRVVRVPDGVESKVAASATCALRTVVHGFERLNAVGGIGIQSSVVILGSGPVGLYALALARVAGAAKTIVVGAPRKRLELAKKWGADHTIDIQEIPDPQERRRLILDLTEGRGPHVVIEAAGPSGAFQEALDLVQRGGKILVIGQTDPTPVEIVPRRINLGQLQIVGVLSATVTHYYKAMQFLKNNQDRFSFQDLISSVYSLEEVNSALRSMADLNEIKPAVVP